VLAGAGLVFAGRLTACGGDDSSASGDDAGEGSAPADGSVGPGLDSNVTLPDGLVVTPDGAPAPPSYSVLQHHRNPSRDGLYVDPLMTRAKAAGIRRDTTFTGAVTGAVYAQPLYVENGPGGKEAFIVATEENHVTALDGTGAVIWDKTFDAPMPNNSLIAPCGNVVPLGITGTPFIDATTRTIYFNAMMTPDNNQTLKHMVHAIGLDDGIEKTGWPLDVGAKISGFDTQWQNQRGALQLVNGTLFVPYGGHSGDCTPYHGWVVGVPVANPGGAKGWATAASQGGIWSVGSLPTDGTYVYPSTGNTGGTNGTWGGGEAIVRVSLAPAFSGSNADFFTPTNWESLDGSDTDLGGANALLLDMPGAPFPHLVVALGKDKNIYLLNRDNLGGIGGELSHAQVADGEINGAPAGYTTAQGTYVAFRIRSSTGHNCPAPGGGGNLAAVKITAGSPPTAAIAWCTNESNLGSPIVTTTDGKANAIVWDANNRLYGYDADTGVKIFTGQSDAGSDQMQTSMQYFNTPIDVKGRIAVAVAGKLYVFR
jgi:hypothetical protein